MVFLHICRQTRLILLSTWCKCTKNGSLSWLLETPKPLQTFGYISNQKSRIFQNPSPLLELSLHNIPLFDSRTDCWSQRWVIIVQGREEPSPWLSPSTESHFLSQLLQRGRGEESVIYPSITADLFIPLANSLSAFYSYKYIHKIFIIPKCNKFPNSVSKQA